MKPVPQANRKQGGLGTLSHPLLTIPSGLRSLRFGPSTSTSRTSVRWQVTMSSTRYNQIILEHRLQYEQQLTNRQIRPFVIPRDILGYVVLIVYLALPSRWRKGLRNPLLFFIILCSLDTLLHCRTLGLAYGVLPGISAAWCVLLTVNRMFLNDPPEVLMRRKGSSGDWQSRPMNLCSRLFWVADLLASPRRIHWFSRVGLDNDLRFPATIRANTVPSLRACLLRLFGALLGIDILKEVIAADSYFWPVYEDKYSALSPLWSLPPYLLFLYRRLTAFLVIYLAIHIIATTSILVFVYALGPRWAGTWGYESAYAPAFGDFSIIGTHGLLGFWGSWWHQFFRTNLRTAAVAINRLVPHEGNVTSEKQMHTLLVFTLSGIIHACGSYTMWGPSVPFHSFQFFLSQFVGICIQIFLPVLLQRCGLKVNSIPKRSRRRTSFTFTALWLLGTSPFLVHDFAQGGMWLAELMPFSFLSVLGLSRRSSSALLWDGLGIGWYTDKRWWLSGVAL